jgi:dTDP-4-amino-4,6-dideoxygalactose transaminase
MSESEYIPFHRSEFGQEEFDEVVAALKSGWITRGPRTARFEEAFRDYVGCRHAVGINSCTAGLHLGLAALGIGPGDEVVTSPVTFPSTASVIVHQGATPVFVDVRKDNLNIDVGKIPVAVTDRTKAIIPVHFAGHPCDMDELLHISVERNIPLVEDAAHAIESVYKGRKIGTIGTVTAFSFYATKNITTGEGGMVCTDRDDLAETMRVMSLHGISKDAWKRYDKNGFQHWEMIAPGYKYNMFDVQAAIGIHQLKRIDGFWTRRKRWSELYNELFSDLEEVTPLTVSPDVKTAYHLYVAILDIDRLKIDRDRFLEQIQNREIGVSVHFRALHLHPYFRETWGFERGMFPVAEYLSDRIFSLPLYPSMTEAMVRRVAAVTREVVEANRK